MHSLIRKNVGKTGHCYIIMNKKHKDQIQQIDMAHRLETILIICGNEIRSAILNIWLMFVFANYLFIDKWDGGS